MRRLKEKSILLLGADPIQAGRLVSVLTELFRLLKTGQSFHILINEEDEYTDKCKHVSNTMPLNLGKKNYATECLLKQFYVYVSLTFQIPTVN